MTPLEIAAVGIGIALFVAGFALLAVARRSSDEPRQWFGFDRISRATETTAGLALVFVGYHVAAYWGPQGWLTFCVPREFGWVVFVGSVLGVGGAIAGDRLLGEPAGGNGE